LTSNGVVIPGSGIGNKGFHREGFVGQFYLGPHFDIQVVTQHGWDNAWFGQGYGGGSPLNAVPGTTLPVGSQAPTWNGYLAEAHYVYSPQLIFIGRFEAERVSRQANGSASATPSPSNLGNLTSYTIGYRYNPFMTSRAGFAWHNEYAFLHQDLASNFGNNVNSSELLIGFDFDF
jgi:hypothetical protein